MREKFKSKKDAIEEKKAIKLLNEKLNGKFTVIHNETPNNHYDFDAYDIYGNLVYIMEFKRRYVNSFTYPTWVIAKIKLERLISIAKQKNCQPMWIFGFNDEYRYCNVNHLTADDLGPVVTIRRTKPRYNNQRGISDVEDGYEVKNNEKWGSLTY